MVKEDRDEIREMLYDILSGQTEEMKGRYNIIHANLVQIKEQTTKTNGRVNVIDEEIEKLKINDIKQAGYCPNTIRVAALENLEVGRKSVYKFISIVAGVTVGTVGVAMAILTYFLKLP